MASAPLLMSNDLKAVPAASKDLLLNTELLAIDQDRLGRMCFRCVHLQATTPFCEALDQPLDNARRF